MMLLICANAFMRYVINTPILGTDLIVAMYLMPASVFLAFGGLQRQHGHIAVTLLTDKLSGRWKRAVVRMSQIAMLVVSAALFYASLAPTISNWSAVTLGVLELPLAPSFVVVSIGFALMFLRTLIQLFEPPVAHVVPPGESAHIVPPGES